MGDSVKLTTFGFDWGDMAVERCFEHKGHRCVRIRSMRTGKYVDIEMSPGGRKIHTSMVRKELKGFDPCGGKRVVEVGQST